MAKADAPMAEHGSDDAFAFIEAMTRVEIGAACLGLSMTTLASFVGCVGA